MKIVVLAGGYSPERNVSLVTASLITKALREAGHQAVFVDAYLGLPNLSELESQALFENLPQIPNCLVDESEIDFKLLEESRVGEGNGIFGPNVLTICEAANLVFIGLHGEAGENGKMQGTFDLLEIPYTGSGAFASALAMDKKIAKILLKEAGIKVPEDLLYHQNQDKISEVLASITYPTVVKPLDGGSSIGISIAKNAEEGALAIAAASKYSQKILLEEYIAGREFSVGFLGEKVFSPIEIIPNEGFYDYKNKYQVGMTKEVCPPENLSAELCETMQNITKKTQEILNLEVYGRVDFLLSERTNELYVIEANTLPGMTPTSLLPQEAKVAGFTFKELCEEIVNLSIRKDS